MPLYSYLCPLCGPFRDIVTMSEAADPQPCPNCAQPAPRQLSAPMLKSAAGATGRPGGAASAHRAGCACCAPRGAFRADGAEPKAASPPSFLLRSP